MNEHTINLIGRRKNKRLLMFKKAIEAIGGFKISIKDKLDVNSDYNILFDFIGYTQQQKNTLISEILELRKAGQFTIFDISEDNFLTSPDADYFLLFSSSCSFITCNSESIQETLYELTGRLCYLVADAKTELDFYPPSSFYGLTEPNVLWFGEVKDIMSIRPYLTNNKHKIRIATPTLISNTKDRAETVFLKNSKTKRDEIIKADIIFLPRTYTNGGELRRYKKVEEGTINGRFVVAPDLEYDWEGLAFKQNLDEAVNFLKNNKQEVIDSLYEAQSILMSKYSMENTTAAIKASLELATQDQMLTEGHFDSSDDNFFLR